MSNYYSRFRGDVHRPFHPTCPIQRRARAAERAIIIASIRAGVSQAEVARVVGLLKQRISQILSACAPELRRGRNGST
jgi:hypothetical protein